MAQMSERGSWRVDMLCPQLLPEADDAERVLVFDIMKHDNATRLLHLVVVGRHTFELVITINSQNSKE